MAEEKNAFTWTFQRMGGLDQVVFHSGRDICRLRELDPKLWVALSCPAHDLEFDQRTLTLIDTDRDGRIRIPEVVDAAEWICARLKDPDVLLAPEAELPLDAIDDSTDFGKRILHTARAILDSLGKKDARTMSQAEVAEASLHASEQILNGDGVLPPLEELGKDVSRYIRDAVAVVGGVEDVSGDVGITREVSDAFVRALADWRDWGGRMRTAETPLGKDTPESWELLAKLRDKITDYFMRCDLVAYAPQAQDALNLEDKPLTDETGLLEESALAELPLAKAGPDKPLDLRTGINPAWRKDVRRFAELTRPLLADPDVLTRDDWQKIEDAIAPFAKAMAEKPAPVVPECVTVPGTKTLESLGGDRVKEILDSGIAERFNTLALEDANGPTASIDMVDMERMVHYYLHLHRLLVNFVNFAEFYDNERTASFQSGSLYIDGRSCHLCMPAGDVEKHAAVAKASQMFLLYCECSRGGKEGSVPPVRQNIVAAVTAGDADLLVESRNGVYVDNQGRDWDARVVRVEQNPIDLWQAILAPYKRVGGMITDQISKHASTKQAQLMASAGKKLENLTAQQIAAAATANSRFDINRNVGVFAAVGLALGALGTALGSIFNAVLSMAWWQLPLLLLGIFLLISGPSVLLAWLKLRRRTLGPLLEASGWAINGRAALTYGVAKRLSRTAELPPGAHRTAVDPVVRMRRVRRSVFWVAVAVGVFATLGIIMYKTYRYEKKTGQLAKVVAEMTTAADAQVNPSTPPATTPAADAVIPEPAAQ